MLLFASLSFKVFLHQNYYSQTERHKKALSEGTSVPSELILLFLRLLSFAFFHFAMIVPAEIIFSNRKTQEGPAPEGTSVSSKLIY